MGRGVAYNVEEKKETFEALFYILLDIPEKPAWIFF